MLLNRTLYVVCVAFLAFSPVLSLFLADLLEFNFAQSDPGWKFMWVGVGLSLPVTLLGARAFGEQAYRDYWSYLESFPRNSRKGILAAWGGMTVFTLAIGIASFWAA